jgi:hypothetical protein
MSGSNSYARGWQRTCLLLIRQAAMLLVMVNMWLGATVIAVEMSVAADSANAFYQIYAPKRIGPGETGTIRLVVQLPAGIAPASLLPVPANISPPTPDYSLSGSFDPCQQLWGKLQASNLEIVGAPALQRTMQSSSTEWTWEVHCPASIQAPSQSTLTILLFARQANAEGALMDIPLKDIRFDVPIVAKAPAVSSSLVLAIFLSLGVLALLAAGWLRKRDAPSGDKRNGGRS